MLEDRTVPSSLFGASSSVVLGPADPVLSPAVPPGPWSPDRYAPAGFTPGQAGGGRVGVLDESISAGDQTNLRPAPYNTGFYDFQGRAYSLAANTTYLAADLYVPASWSSLDQTDLSGNPASYGSLASLWATGVDATNATQSYPIVGFNNDGTNNGQTGTAGFQVFDQTNGWTDVGGFSGYDKWYRIGFGINSQGQFEYFVNGKLVYTDANTSGTAAFSNVMLQGYNGGNNYDTYWDNLNTTQGANRAYVLGLYRDLLGRDGSTDAGVTAWANALDNLAWSRSDVASGILNSAEYRDRQVDHFYQAFLGRQADAYEQAMGANYLQHGGTEEEMVASILSSGEYQAKFPNDADFVASLYDGLLFRTASPNEVQGWVNNLNAGASRADVVRGFLQSQEATVRAVDTVYTFLRRDADSTERDGRAGLLQQPDGKAIDAMLTVLASDEYASRFSA
jgi:hypothetical protein